MENTNTIGSLLGLTQKRIRNCCPKCNSPLISKRTRKHDYICRSCNSVFRQPIKLEKSNQMGHFPSIIKRGVSCEQ